MDAAGIIILLLALLAAIALLRLVIAIRNSWDGDIEDLYEDVVIGRLVFLGLADVVIGRLVFLGLAVGALVAVLLLRGPLRSALAMLFG